MSVFQFLKQTSCYFTSVCRLSSKWISENEIHVYQWKKNFRINKTRCYFPRPSETMRIKKHGWDARMSTIGGRKVLMNRILKGRHVLSH